MLKLVDTSQKFIILGIFILDKVTRLRALLDPPPPQDGVSELTGRDPLPPPTLGSGSTSRYPLGLISLNVHLHFILLLAFSDMIACAIGPYIEMYLQ